MNFTKLLPKGIVLMIALLSAVGCQASTQTQTPTLTPAPTGISISGVVTNLDEARSYLTEEYYLQLVPGTGGQLSGDTVTLHSDGMFTYIESGDITYVLDRVLSAHVESDLATAQISSDGSFTFQIDSLAPGAYFVVAQDFQSFDMNWVGSNVMALAEENGNPDSIVVIEVPEGVSLPFIIELEEVVVILP